MLGPTQQTRKLAEKKLSNVSFKKEESPEGSGKGNLNHQDEVGNRSGTYEGRGLKLVHLNITILHGKIDQLRIAVEGSGVDIVTLSETWVKGFLDSQLLSLKGYTMLRQDRNLEKVGKKNGGGLMTHIRTSK